MATKSENILYGPQQIIKPLNFSFGEYMYWRLKSGGETVAQIDAQTGRTKTYKQILTESVQLAQCLKAEGLLFGDVISICSENRFEFVLPALAALYMGYITAPLNFMYTERELNHTLSISKPKIMFCSDLVVKKIHAILHQNPCIQKFIVFGNDDYNIPNVITFDKYLESMSDYCTNMFLPVSLNPVKSIAVILCSSGTTGLPKGVMLSHYNFLICAEHLQDPRSGNLTRDCIVLSILPYFHAYGFVTQLIKLSINMKIIVVPRFEENMFLNAIQKYKVTHAFLVPPILLFLAKSPLVDKYDLSSFQEIWCGAAPLGREVLLLVMKRLNMSCIRQGYGMTETTLAVLVQPPDSLKYGSVGCLAPGTEAKVVDLETGVALGPNRDGELCFRGDLIMMGYLGDRQATSAIMDTEGWLHTGDVGYYDNEEYFYIVDRLKELIKYKGFQVPPAELETVLLSNAMIKDAAVVGIPDEEAGELPLAFVVKQPGVNLTSEKVMRFVADNVSPHKRLYGGVIFLSEIPKSASGKILRRELRDMIKRQNAHL